MAETVTEIQKQIAQTQEDIAKQQAELTQAKQDLSSPIKTPTLSQVQLRGLSRLQKQ